jgi:Cytochrome c oxidase subunit IV
VSDRPVAGTEGPRGHEAAPVDDRSVPWRVFGFVGAFMGLLAAIYWFTAYEDAGTVMLVVAGVLAAWIAAYLWLQQRGPVGPAIEAREAADDASAAAGRALPGTGTAEGAPHYLPHASAWPFAIGVGAATVANGLVLGLWVIVPGAVLMVLGIIGFVRQTRRRD